MKIRVKISILVFLFSSFVVSGAAVAGLSDFFKAKPGTETKVTAGQNAPDINQAQAEAYNGPKARVAVTRFKDKTGKGWWTGAIGDGMADQLVTALFNTNRFVVLERQTLGDVLNEQDLGASGRIRQDTAAPIGQIEGAELLITGAVTEFEGNASGTRGGAGGILGGVLGAIGGAVRKSHMAIDIRVIDAKTSRILAATSVEGASTDVNIGGAIGGYFGGGALGGALSSWENTPKEKALRACINKAVEFIVSKTPPTYYRHGAGTARARPARAESPKVQTFAAGSGVRVKSKSLNIRRGPGTGNPVVFSAASGAPLLVEEQQGRWIKVRAADQQVGWAAGWLVTPDPSVTPASMSVKVAPLKVTPNREAVKPTGGRSVESRLKQLKTLLNRKLITEEEYNKKRDKILEEL